MTRRAAWAVLCAVSFSALAATPASAHSVSGVSATNYETRLVRVTPAPIRGVSVRVIETGSRLELTNTTSTEITVFGSVAAEPYLRIGPDGVFENLESPSTYLNTSRTGSPVPDGVDGKGPPRWRKLSNDTTVRWHDHRIHWMGSVDHPVVKRDPGRRHLLAEWTVPMRYGDADLAAAGTLTWVPGPSPVPWLALAALVAMVTGAVGLRTRRRSREVLVALLLAALVTIDVAHATGTALAGADALTTSVRRLAGSSLLSGVGWLAGAAGVFLLARRDRRGWAAAVFGSLLLLGTGGLADIADLSRSQVPFEPSAVAARAIVALTVALGAVVAVIAGTMVSRPESSSPNSDPR